MLRFWFWIWGKGGEEANDIIGAGISNITDEGVYGFSLINSIGSDGLSTITANLSGVSLISDQGVYGNSIIDSVGIDGEGKIEDGI